MTGPLKYENQRRAARELFKDANIEIAAATHAARHSFVTHAEQAGCAPPGRHLAQHCHQGEAWTFLTCQPDLPYIK